MKINLETWLGNISNLETRFLIWKQELIYPYQLENIIINLKTLFLTWKHRFEL